MKLEIISSEKVLFSGEVRRVTLPGTVGQFTVLDHHASLLSTLQAGNIVYELNGTEESMPIEGGLVEVNDNRVAVCIS